MHLPICLSLYIYIAVHTYFAYSIPSSFYQKIYWQGRDKDFLQIFATVPLRSSECIMGFQLSVTFFGAYLQVTWKIIQLDVVVHAGNPSI